jgi:ribose-phosphate pyrophosphokinase
VSMGGTPKEDGKHFFTAANVSGEQDRGTESSRGRLLISSCRSGTYLAKSVSEHYGKLHSEYDHGHVIPFLGDIDFQFSDSETCVRLEEDVSGSDIFLFQALYDPGSGRSVDENYMALMLAAKTFQTWGARHITAVVPYLAYARQDKPTWFRREPTTAKLMADLGMEAGIGRLVTWHPHCNQIQGFYGDITVDILDSLAFFTEEFSRFQSRDDVLVIAPDAGASKFVTYFGRRLGLKCAIASKFRPRPEEAQVSEIIGDFSGKKTAIVLDDMIGSGGTVHELIKKVVGEHDVEEVCLGVSHNLCMAKAMERLLELHENYHLKEVIVTESIPQTEDFAGLPFLKVRSLADTITRVINRIHYNRSVSGLFYV